jgi:hypothetical protein
MKTMNNYEAPVAEMIEMHMPVVLMDSFGGGGTASTPSVVPSTPGSGPSLS